MSDSLSPLAYFGLAFIILLIVGVNFMLLQALRNKKGLSEIDLMKKIGSRLKQPWKPEDEQLQALSIMVQQYKRNDPSPPHPSEENTENQ